MVFADALDLISNPCTCMITPFHCFVTPSEHRPLHFFFQPLLLLLISSVVCSSDFHIFASSTSQQETHPSSHFHHPSSIVLISQELVVLDPADFKVVMNSAGRVSYVPASFLQQQRDDSDCESVVRTVVILLRMSYNPSHLNVCSDLEQFSSANISSLASVWQYGFERYVL